MFIHTIKKVLMPGPISLTRHRIDLISGSVCTLLQVRLVNLRKLACSLPGTAHIAKKTQPHKKTWTKSPKPSSTRIRPTHTDHKPNPTIT